MTRALALIAGALGLGYIVTKLTKKSGTSSTIKVVPAKPIVPSMPLEPPPEPQGGWQSYMSTQTVQTVLIQCRDDAVARNETELRACAMQRIFPDYQWKMRLGWQELAWNSLGNQIMAVAEVESWPFHATPGARDIAVIFWLMAHRVVRECTKTNVTLDQIRTCAAKAMFPDQTWPPPNDASAAIRAVWDRLATVIAQQSP
jgi:hypothetical protein